MASTIKDLKCQLDIEVVYLDSVNLSIGKYTIRITSDSSSYMGT